MDYDYRNALKDIARELQTLNGHLSKMADNSRISNELLAEVRDELEDVHRSVGNIRT